MPRLIREIILAVKAYYSALPYISSRKLGKFFIIPAIINLVLFVAIGFLAYSFSGDIIKHLSTYFEIDQEDTLGTLARFFLALTIRLIIVFLYLKVYRYTMLILLAPVLALMAEKLVAEKSSSGTANQIRSFFQNALRGMIIALTNLIREIALTLLILISAILIPIITPFAPILIFTIESYYYGFSMIDYFNEIKNRSAKASRKMIWEHKGLAIGNGAIFNFILIIPIIGVLVAPLIALTAAHLSIVEFEDTSND